MKQLITLLILLIHTIAFAEDWPQWRGVNRDGISNETGLLKKWPENGPRMFWKIDGLGKGYSSAAVVNDKVYITGTINDSLEVLNLIDSKGKLIWQTVYGDAWIKGDFRASRCTPTIKDGKAYVISGNNDIACINAKTGKLEWKVVAVEKFKAQPHKIQGVAESPLIISDKLISTPCGKQTAVVALNCKNGETIWESKPLGDESLFVSPMLFHFNGKDVIIAVSGENTLGINAKDGKTEWILPRCSYFITPIVKGNLVFTGGDMLSFSSDSGKYHEEWKLPEAPGHGGVILVNDLLFGEYDTKSNNVFTCIDWKSGEILYKMNTIKQSSLISAEGLLYNFQHKSGKVSLIKAARDQAEIISSFKVEKGDQQYWAHPSISNKKLYIRNDETLWVYDIGEK